MELYNMNTNIADRIEKIIHYLHLQKIDIVNPSDKLY